MIPGESENYLLKNMMQWLILVHRLDAEIWQEEENYESTD